MISETAAYLRRIAAHDSVVTKTTDVINIDVISDGAPAGTMVLDLSDGTTIRLDWERYDR